MSPFELIALSLGASIAVAVVVGLAATGFERLCADPGLRERVWALALYLPVLPPVLVGGLLLTPAPVRPVLVQPVQTEVIPAVPIAVADVVPVASGFSMDWSLVAVIALGLAALLIGARGLSLVWRTVRLRRLVARAIPATAEACTAVAEAARLLKVAAPEVRATTKGGDALLTGLTRPLLILPDALAEAPHSPAARAVIAHELAHLKRGDHRAVWLEEGMLALLAVNPVLPLIRARRAAAREEACDALALSGAEPSARRLYAQSLIEALRARTDPMLAVPALTFTGTPRSQAMRRLKAILTPPATAGRGVRIAAIVSGLALVGLVGAGSVAVAAQREARIAMDAGADAPLSAPDHAFISAAMDPIYKAAWPESCGFGSGGSDGQVFVQTGEGCSPAGGPQVLIQSLEGVSPSKDPRAAFAAVKAACDASRPVRIAFSQGGTAGLKTAGCASPAVAPPTPVRFMVDIAYDPAIDIAVGDRLEIGLNRELGNDSKASTGMEFDLAPGALPQQAFADLMPPLLPADRNGPMFAMTARIIDRDGVVKAVSDRDLGRPHAPYIVAAKAIVTKLQMVPIAGAQAASEDARQSAIRSAQAAAAAARAALTPAQRARADAARSGAGFKAICSANNSANIGLCDGVMFGAALRNIGGNICLPEGYDRGVMVQRATSVLAREAPRPGEDATTIATRVIAKAYPCAVATVGSKRAPTPAASQTSGPPPIPGTARLTIALDYGDRPLVLTREDRLRISLSGVDEEGTRFEQASVFELAPGVDLPDVTWLDLGRVYFPPIGGANRTYTLTAQIENGDGGPVRYAAEPSTIRLASGSQERLANLGPEMVFRPVASTRPQ